MAALSVHSGARSVLHVCILSLVDTAESACSRHACSGCQASACLVDWDGVVREAVGVIRVYAADVLEVQPMLAAALVTKHIARKGAHAQLHQVHEAGIMHVCLLIRHLRPVVPIPCMHCLLSRNFQK
jgi:hypothetical protein